MARTGRRGPPGLIDLSSHRRYRGRVNCKTHFGEKTTINATIASAGCAHFTFAVAPFHYENLAGQLAPQRQADGSIGWSLLIDPNAKVMLMGAILEFGDRVAGVFLRPDEVGRGRWFAHVGEISSFGERRDSLRGVGHDLVLSHVNSDGFPAELSVTFEYFAEHSSMGGHASVNAALADPIGKRRSDVV